VRLAFASAILILLVVGGFSYRGLDAAGASDRWVAHTHEVLENLQLLRLAMASVEADDRRYALSGNREDLEASRAGLASANRYTAAVSKLTIDNPRQQRRTPALQGLLDQKRRSIELLLGLRDARGAEAAIVRGGLGQRIMAQSEAVALELQDEELRLLALRSANQVSSQTKAVIILGTSLALLVTAGAGWSAHRDSIRRERAEADLREKVDELGRSNAELEAFAYVASHDLQEPLRMVGSYVELLSNRYKGQLDADADQFIDFAVDGARRMQQLIQDLLAYSHLGTTAAALIYTSSEEALDQALANLHGAIADSGAMVTHGVLPPVMADKMQLTQLFQNLVGNAIKYQNPGVPRIHVSAARNAERKWLFAVKDNGLGIEPQYFEKIFGMFQRLHGRQEFSGTGIGLAICKKIVERHGGSISVESQSGQGATFRFALAAA
jgi:signal transduction histidine kinase